MPKPVKVTSHNSRLTHARKYIDETELEAELTITYYEDKQRVYSFDLVCATSHIPLILKASEVADFSVLLAQGLYEDGVIDKLFDNELHVTLLDNGNVEIYFGTRHGDNRETAILEIPLEVTKKISKDLNHWVQTNQWPLELLSPATNKTSLTDLMTATR